jgi:DNA-binding MarR family transcriptional regulator
MEEAGLVARARDNGDRRMVSARITEAGLRLLDRLDAPLGDLHQRRMGHLSDDQLSQLIDLLTLARNSG